MATDLDKYAHRARLWGMVVVSMTKGIWDLVEDSAVTLSPFIGENLLAELEKSAGFEVAGEKPEHMLVELGRILVDEVGYATEAKVEAGDKSYKLILINAVGLPEFKSLEAKGITKPFSNPVYCTGLAAMARLGYKCRAKMDIDLDTKTQTTTFDLL
jgi:hypothetical protein